jgi:pimeloyl-ACP methyl ester carboxylesterase
MRTLRESQLHPRWLVAALAAACALVVHAPEASATARVCHELYVPVTFSEAVPNAVVYGELCRPKQGEWPSKILFFVHGSTHNHYMWDFPFKAKDYSYVEKALAGGWATFNIDRVGTGQSTRPHSALVTVDGTIESLHQLAVKLRSGTICAGACDAPPFQKITYFGSSLSTAYGWQLGSTYPGDVDGFVLAGLAHFTLPSWFGLVEQHIVPANTDPLFDASLDSGYVTTQAGYRDAFFINPEATHRRVPALDESLKGEVSAPLMFESAFRYVVNPQPGPGGSPSWDIGVPVILTMSEYDGTACGAGGPLPVCTATTVRDYEQQFYSVPLEVTIGADARHSISIHDSFNDVFDFIEQRLRAHGL